MKSFVDYSKNCYFPIENIPFGVFQLKGNQSFQNNKQIGCAIGDYVINLSKLIDDQVINLNFIEQKAMKHYNLDKFLKLNKYSRTKIRKQVQDILLEGSIIEQNKDNYLIHKDNLLMKNPFTIGDYTDFYASKQHAENVGELFRGKDNKLMPNWTKMPIAYHGRSSTINIGNMCVRPQGYLDLDQFGLETKLDIELELACVMGKSNQEGQYSQIPIHKAQDCIAGFLLMNDLSARAIQRFEYQPLGPFLGKNFSTKISPWLVLPEALEPFKVEKDHQEGIQDYLKNDKLTFYDIPLQIKLRPQNETQFYNISNSNTQNLYWSFEQMIAHHSVNGCKINSGDLLGSGTISGDCKETQTGSLLELTWNNTKPLQLGSVQQGFLNDGDSVILEGGNYLKDTQQMLGFGPVQTNIIGQQEYQEFLQNKREQKEQRKQKYQ